MNCKVYDSYAQMSADIAADIGRQLAKKPGSLISLAAGHTSLGIFEELITLYEAGNIDFSKSFFLAMDEWMGMSAVTPGSCGDFLNKNLLSKVNFVPDHVRLMNGGAENMEKECTQLCELLSAHGGLDYILLGVGMNGHLALNEPGVDFSLSVHTTVLDETTQQVGKKYFSGTAPMLMGGITLGIRDIREAKRVVLGVSGRKKSEILKKLFTEPVGTQLPASVIRELPQAKIVYDKEATALL